MLEPDCIQAKEFPCNQETEAVATALYKKRVTGRFFIFCGNHDSLLAYPRKRISYHCSPLRNFFLKKVVNPPGSHVTKGTCCSTLFLPSQYRCGGTEMAGSHYVSRGGIANNCTLLLSAGNCKSTSLGHGMWPESDGFEIVRRPSRASSTITSCPVAGLQQRATVSKFTALSLKEVIVSSMNRGFKRKLHRQNHFLPKFHSIHRLA